MTTYLITVEASYNPNEGTPQSLASAVESAMLDIDYSLVLRPNDNHRDPDDYRSLVGMLTRTGSSLV